MVIIRRRILINPKWIKYCLCAMITIGNVMWNNANVTIGCLRSAQWMSNNQTAPRNRRSSPSKVIKASVGDASVDVESTLVVGGQSIIDIIRWVTRQKDYPTRWRRRAPRHSRLRCPWRWSAPNWLTSRALVAGVAVCPWKSRKFSSSTKVSTTSTTFFVPPLQSGNLD